MQVSSCFSFIKSEFIKSKITFAHENLKCETWSLNLLIFQNKGTLDELHTFVACICVDQHNFIVGGMQRLFLTWQLTCWQLIWLFCQCKRLLLKRIQSATSHLILCHALRSYNILTIFARVNGQMILVYMYFINFTPWHHFISRNEISLGITHTKFYHYLLVTISGK